ncbi:hypothetical protein H4J02_03695 [Protaetiibacter sp. SSC-01]|uniref:hypothetical protein n=1 Tax=Protaetiibacter sp. SSC-01 TaxID=2759943 RepID=UPI001657600F|nr:hypothetical protein [Protaetiibacter sp. SSC-01]QNO38144.1 hypothetical protein H4J02_03695 [Protaetiibacter sp. SSC-01]
MSIYDPVPEALTGSPTTISAKARVMTATADALRTAISELRSLASEDVTISEAVDELRVKADGVRHDVEKVETRYRSAATAMVSYHNKLGSAQTRAEAARQRIRDNNSEAAYWRRKKVDIEQRVRAGENSQELLDELLDVKNRVAGYANEFANAMSEYLAAEGDKEDAVTAAMSALQNAADTAGLDDGFWDRVGAVIEVMYEWAQENLGPWIEAIRSVLEIIKGIIDLLSLIVGVLALFLPFLAPLAAALTLVSIGLAAAVLLCSLVLFALGRESLGRVLSDTIGLATSVITAKLGGIGDKLKGIGNFKPGNWGSLAQTAKADFAMARFEFALTRSIVGTGETVGIYGMEIANKLLPSSKTDFIKLGVSTASGFLGKGLDVNFDLFPESGPGGTFGPFEGGWDLSSDDVLNASFKPVVNVLSGGAANPSISIGTNIEKLSAGVS